MTIILVTENKMDKPTISIVIPAYNAGNTISKAIKASLEQTYPSDKIEVIVVDDGSADNTADIVKTFPVQYIYQNNAGPAKARNTGWKASKGEIIFFTDSDCVPEKECIEKLVTQFTDDCIAAAGGTYGIVNPESLIAQCIHYEIQYRHSTLPDYVNYLGSFNLAVRRSALQAMDGFDETFLIACAEDADLSYRLTANGYKLKFNKNSIAGHHFPSKFIKYLKQQFYRGYWLMKIFKKHFGKLGKDDYSKFRDVIQPPLYFLIIISSPFCFLNNNVLYAWLFLNIFAIMVHLPVVKYSLKSSGNPKLLFLFIMLYLRGFMWALGCFAGFFKFVLRKQKPFLY